jgi:hypothetical protein
VARRQGCHLGRRVAGGRRAGPEEVVCREEEGPSEGKPAASVVRKKNHAEEEMGSRASPIARRTQS